MTNKNSYRIGPQAHMYFLHIGAKPCITHSTGRIFYTNDDPAGCVYVTNDFDGNPIEIACANSSELVMLNNRMWLKKKDDVLAKDIFLDHAYRTGNEDYKTKIRQCGVVDTGYDLIWEECNDDNDND